MGDQTFVQFMKILKKILGYPPYLVFVFVGTIFLTISIGTENYFEQSLIFFLYAVSGSVWRHAIKDIRGRYEKKYPASFNTFNLWWTSFYQLVNLGLVTILILLILNLD